MHVRTTAIFGALLSLVSSSAFGFSTQGHRWTNPPGTPVTFELDPTGSDDVPDDTELEAIQRAFMTWEGVACSYLRFEEQPWSGQRATANDLHNRIFWVETQNEWGGNQGTLALTYTYYRLDGDMRITDADIVINGVNWTWTTHDEEVGMGTPAKIDVETVLFHEIGHFFGLDHSNDPQAAMYPSNNKLTQREPAADDIAGICSLYSNGEPVPGDPGNPTGQNGGPVGAPCQAPIDCASSLCIDDQLINRQYCTAQCAPERPETCPAGFLCEQTQMGAYCLAPAPVDELCDQCNDGSHCASGLCIQVPNVNNGAPFCSRACDPTPGQPAQCEEGYACMVTQQQTTQLAACVPTTGICQPTGKGGQNEPCFGNGACKPGHACLEYYPGTGIAFCFGVCPIQYDGLSCGVDRSRCTAQADIPNTAVCLTIASAGQPCIPEVCDQFSFCAYEESIGFDSALCYQVCTQSGCPPNFSCTPIGEGLPALCVPNEGFKYDGESCAGSAECQSSLCQNLGQLKLCTRQCAASDPDGCEPGLRCVPEPGSSQGLCWPESLSDPEAQDPTRNVGMVPNIAGFCSCDSTNECDGDCACDPECSGCGCTTTDSDRSSAWWALPLAMLVFVRRRWQRL
jgi:MYXO-CTERM domain-containing protein